LFKYVQFKHVIFPWAFRTSVMYMYRFCMMLKCGIVKVVDNQIELNLD